MTATDLRAMAADGCTRAEAAAELGVSVRRVRRLAARCGVRFTPGRRMDVTARCRVLDLIAAGVPTAAAVARLIGRPANLVGLWVQEYERAGLVARTGAGSSTRLAVTGEWS